MKGWTALPVNVLIMAKNKKNITAGDLFSRLGRRGGDKSASDGADAKKNRNARADRNVPDIDNENEFLDENDSIDVTRDEGDSELDINSLLKKYMPDYDSGNDSDSGEDDDGSAEAHRGGVLSRLKGAGKELGGSRSDEAKSEDEQLIDSLDNAFGIPEDEDDARDGGFIDEYDLEEGAYSDGDDYSEDEEYIEEEAPAVAVSRNGKKNTAAHEMTDEEFDATFDDVSDAELASDEAGAYTEEEYEEEPDEELPDEEPDDIPEGAFDEDEAEGEYDVDGTVPENAEENEDKADYSDIDDEELSDAADEYLRAMSDEDDGGKKKTRFIFPFMKKDKAENAEEDTTNGTCDADGTGGGLTEAEEDENAPVPAESTTEEQSDADFDDASDEENGDIDIDPTDINLMVAFGLDADNNKKAKEFGDRLEAKQSKSRAKRKLDHPEFIDKSQTPAIKKELHDKQVALGVKLGVCAVLTVLLMIFENIPFITKLFTGSEKQFAGVLDPAVYPTVYIMISLQLMLLACFCALDEIVDGFKYIFRGTPKPESMTSLLTVAGIVYSVVAARITKSPTEPVMFNFVTAMSACMTLVYSLYNTKRERMNFAVVANRKPKHIVRRLPDEEARGEAKAFADNEDVCDVMKIEKTGFVDGFFSRLERPDSSMGVFMTFAMSVSVAAGVLFGIFANLKGGDSVTVCRVVYSSLLVIAPMSAYITFSYPFYRANVAAKQYDSAIIGETSLEEYSNASIISFDDKNVFPSYSVKVQNIRIYNNARIDRVLYYAASVFAYAGGPLQDVFEIATKDMGCSQNVKIFDTEAGFLATQVDGVNIIFGNAQALGARGLEIPENALRDDVDLSDELSIMYMFRENKLVAKMYIRYVMDADIDLILKQFYGSGLYVCVRTFDPNIDEAMIAKKAGMKKMPLKIVRYVSTDEVGAFEEKVDSGLVTCGTPKSLLQVISYCGKVLHTKKTDIALGVLSVMIGLAILTLLLLSNSLSVLTSLLIVFYQLIWLIPITIASKVFIR